MTLATVITGVADTLDRFLVTGGQWPSASTPAAIEQLILRTRNAAAVAANYVAAAIPVFVDEVVSTHRQLAALEDLLPGVPIVVLAASDDVVLRRDATRTKHTAASYLGIAHDITAVLGDRAAWIDTTGLTVEQTVRAVVESISLPERHATR